MELRLAKMNVGQVGPGGVNRNAGRPEKPDPQKTPAEALPVADKASISSDGRDYLASVEALTRKLKHQDDGREQRVREVSEKLQSGELDNEQVYRAVAEAILDA
jgi:hypothetical protein